MSKHHQHVRYDTRNQCSTTVCACVWSVPHSMWKLSKTPTTGQADTHTHLVFCIHTCTALSDNNHIYSSFVTQSSQHGPCFVHKRTRPNSSIYIHYSVTKPPFFAKIINPQEKIVEKNNCGRQRGEHLS